MIPVYKGKSLWYVYSNHAIFTYEFRFDVCIISSANSLATKNVFPNTFYSSQRWVQGLQRTQATGSHRLGQMIITCDFHFQYPSGIVCPYYRVIGRNHFYGVEGRWTNSNFIRILNHNFLGEINYSCFKDILGIDVINEAVLMACWHWQPWILSSTKLALDSSEPF